MNFFNLIIALQVVSALAIIGLVLMQHGKGADMGAAFGSGASGSLFGASGSSNFMSKATAVAAIVFFGTTLALAALAGKTNSSSGSGSIMERAAPAASASAAASAPAVAAPAASAAASAPAASVPASPSGQIPK